MEAAYEFKLIVARKLNYFSKRLISIYEGHGFKNIPFERTQKQEMIKSCANDILAFFEKVFLDKELASHLVDKFYDYAGNINEFFCSLDNTNMDLILTRNW
jgi:hypothetical protein